MNKTKLISLSLVLCLVLMGAAFAWWTQSTVIQNTVNTGNLDIKLVDIGGPGIYFTNPNNNPDSIGLDIREHYKVRADYEFVGNYSLNVNVENLFPGSYITYIYGVDNTGTVPVKVNNVDLIAGDQTTLSSDILKDLPIAFCYRVVKSDNTVSSEGVVDGTYSDIAQKIETALANVVIVPGDMLVIGDLDATDEYGQVQNGFMITIPEEWENETEGKAISFSLKFDYIQANAYEKVSE